MLGPDVELDLFFAIHRDITLENVLGGGVVGGLPGAHTGVVLAGVLPLLRSWSSDSSPDSVFSAALLASTNSLSLSSSSTVSSPSSNSDSSSDSWLASPIPLSLVGSLLCDRLGGCGESQLWTNPVVGESPLWENPRCERIPVVGESLLWVNPHYG